MQEKKFSNLNDEINVRLFFYLLKKNILLFFILFFISITIAYLYLRYTPAIYETYAIIQFSTENEATKILKTDDFNFKEETSLEKQMELMRSSVFLQRVFAKLPLDVSYFVVGRLLDFELYKNTPFTVSYNVKNASIYDVPVFVSFPDENKVKISYKINKSGIEKTYNIKDQIILNEVDLKFQITNPEALKSKGGLLSNDKFYIILNNPITVVARYIKNLKIYIMNPAAKTVCVSYRHENSNKASDIVNAIAEEFLIYDIEKKAESTNKIIDFIDKTLNRIYDTLAKSENQLDDFKKSNSIDSLKFNEVPTLFSRQSELENQYSKLEMEENMLNELENSFKVSDDVDIYKLIASVAGSEFQGTISELLNTLQNLLIKREQLLYEVTPNSKQIESVNYQINIQKKLLIESIKSLKYNITSRKNNLKEKIKNYDKLINSKSGDYNAIELNRLQRIYSINEKFHNQLIEKRAEYSILKAGYVSQNLILEKSTPPSYPISPKKKQIYLIAVIISFLICLVIVLVVYLFYNEIKSVEDIVRQTNASILGVIPKYHHNIKSLMVVDVKPKSLLAESLRIVRTNLQFISNEPGPKVIAITSTISGEGKTFIATNLAGILAFSDKKVIILDLDMRKPKIHSVFGNKNDVGMSSILAGQTKFANCIRHTLVKNLDYISAGPIPPNPSELIINQRMDELLLQLKTRYDFIIIDNPPVGLVADGIKSLIKSDYPIYVLKANYSKKSYITNIDHLIDDNSIHSLSIILNALDSENLSFGRPKSYLNGYGYGYYDDDVKKRSVVGNIIRFLRLNKIIKMK